MFEEYLQYYLLKSWIGRAIVLCVTRYVESCTKFHVQMCARQFSDTPFVSVVISAIAVANRCRFISIMVKEVAGRCRAAMVAR